MLLKLRCRRKTAPGQPPALCRPLSSALGDFSRASVSSPAKKEGDCTRLSPAEGRTEGRVLDLQRALSMVPSTGPTLYVPSETAGQTSRTNPGGGRERAGPGQAVRSFGVWSCHCHYFPVISRASVFLWQNGAVTREGPPGRDACGRWVPWLGLFPTQVMGLCPRSRGALVGRD